MRLLISSKYLASELNKIDFEKQYVDRVWLNEKEMIIIFQEDSLKIPVTILDFKASVGQENRRWDWIKKLANSAEDQPIILEINENATKVIFQY